ncbi:MAG: hypothetical protein AAGJ28_18475, partial [Pseudomonadota bacterium]
SMLPNAGGTVCRFCGVASTVDVCSRPACQTELTREKARNVQRRLLDGLRAKAAAVAAVSSETLADEADKLGRNIDDLAVAVLPRVERPLVAVPEDALQQMIDQLDAAIAEAFSDPEGGVAIDRADIDEDEPELGDACCATCRGNCCQVGRQTNAFLDATTIRHVRSLRPKATPEEIREIYLSRVPDVAAKDSCVFHGPMGCTLERDTRADICNRHRCLPLQLFLRSASFRAPGAALLIGAGDDGPPVVATLHRDGTRTERAIGPKEEPSDEVVAVVSAQVPEEL